MSEIQEGSFEHTLEEIDSATSQVFNAKGDFPNLESALAAKQDDLDFDEKPVENSTNPILSGGVFPLQDALAKIIDDDYKVNYLEPPAEGSTGTEVNFTLNADGSIKATVVATTTASRSLNWYFTCPAGNWVFSTNQAASGASPAPCFAYLYGSSSIANDYSGTPFTMNQSTSIRCFIQIRSGTPAGSEYTFYPMICAPEWYAVSKKYVQYSGT